MISRTSGGAPATGGDSFHAVLSVSGRYAAFASEATNLPGDDAWDDVYLHDRRTGRTRLMSKTSAGGPTTGGDSRSPALDSRGRHLAFTSEATNLAGGGAVQAVFVRGPLR